MGQVKGVVVNIYSLGTVVFVGGWVTHSNVFVE